MLAHELGHISYNLNGIELQSGYNVSPSDDEEFYAWTFAYSMLDAKSHDYKGGVGTDEYIYRFDELNRLLMRNIKRQQPDRHDLHDRIRQFLKA
jgi:hypothetical protein